MVQRPPTFAHNLSLVSHLGKTAYVYEPKTGLLKSPKLFFYEAKTVFYIAPNHCYDPLFGDPKIMFCRPKNCFSDPNPNIKHHQIQPQDASVRNILITGPFKFLKKKNETGFYRPLTWFQIQFKTFLLFTSRTDFRIPTSAFYGSNNPKPFFL